MFLDTDSNLVEKVSNDNMKNLSMEEKKKLQMLAKRPMKQLKLELDGLMVSKSADSGTGSQLKLFGGDPSQRAAKSTNDSFKCGLCGYEAEIEEQIYAHWNFGCDAFKVEKRRGLPEAYQCSGCGVRMESKSLIERHMNFECQGFQEKPLKMTNLNAY